MSYQLTPKRHTFTSLRLILLMSNSTTNLVYSVVYYYLWGASSALKILVPQNQNFQRKIDPPSSGKLVRLWKLVLLTHYCKLLLAGDNYNIIFHM